MTVATIDRIAAEQQQRREQAFKQYHDMVVAMARDEDTDASAMIDIMEAASKSHDDLRDDIEVVKDRIAHVDLLSHRPDAQRQRNEIKQTLRKMAQDFERIQNQHNEASQRLYEQSQDLDNIITTANAAEIRLRRTVIDQSLIAKRGRIEAEREPLFKELRKLSSSLAPMNFDGSMYALTQRRSALVASEAALAETLHSGNQSSIVAAQREVERDRAAVAEMQERIDRMGERKRDLEQAFRELEDAMTDLSNLELIP